MITTTCGIALLTIALNWCDATKSTSLQEREAIETPYMSNRQLIEIERQKYQEKVFDLAINLYHEERSKSVSDSEIAQIGYVVLNRVKSHCYPDTVKGVIYQKYQFSWYWDGKSDKMLDKVAKERAFMIADKILKREINDLTGGATHYLNKRLTNATWYRNMESRGTFGAHDFYLEGRCK